MLPRFRRLLLCLSLVLAPLAYAAGGGGGGAAPMQFTLNIGQGGPHQATLVVGLVLKPADDEAAKTLDTYKPAVQHEIIQAISASDPQQLRSREGMVDLAQRIADAVNAVIGATRKTGVKEVLFTAFLLQGS